MPSQMPLHPMMPAVSTTVTSSGTSTKTAPMMERSASADRSTMIADTCTTLRIFSCTTTSFIAAWAPSDPPAMPIRTGKPRNRCSANSRVVRNSRSANADSSLLVYARIAARRWPASISPLRSSGPDSE